MTSRTRCASAPEKLLAPSVTEAVFLAQPTTGSLSTNYSGRSADGVVLGKESFLPLLTAALRPAQESTVQVPPLCLEAQQAEFLFLN